MSLMSIANDGLGRSWRCLNNADASYGVDGGFVEPEKSAATEAAQPFLAVPRAEADGGGDAAVFLVIVIVVDVVEDVIVVDVVVVVFKVEGAIGGNE